MRSGAGRRRIAQTEIRFSNLLIESWWRVLKHQWLYLNTFDTVATVRKLVAFYVDQHCSLLQIPDSRSLASPNSGSFRSIRSMRDRYKLQSLRLSFPDCR